MILSNYFKWLIVHLKFVENIPRKNFLVLFSTDKCGRTLDMADPETRNINAGILNVTQTDVDNVNLPCFARLLHKSDKIT